jgi:hypothetical protein
MTNATPSSSHCRRVFMSARDIARCFSGGPSLLVSARLAPGDRSVFGFDTILVSVDSSSVRFFRPGEAGVADDFIETEELPSDLLAIVAEPGDADALTLLWSDLGQVAPPIVAVAEVQDAIGPIVAQVKAEIAAATARSAELQRALVATRAEFEETRAAMQGVMRTLSHRYATKMNLVTVAAPSKGTTLSVRPSEGVKRVYAVSTEGVTCIALHVAALRAEADTVLRVALLGEESGRVLGEWRRPGSALSTGWNVFDFPTPVAAVRETVAVAVAVDGRDASEVVFSLSGEKGGEQPLAIRIWTADAGGRFPHAEHWVWNAQGAPRSAAGTVMLVGAEAIAQIVARGRLDLVRDQDGSVESYLLRGGSSLLHLADFSVDGAEAVCVELKHGFGDVLKTRFELVVQSPEHGFTSGWRSFGAGETILRLALSVPAALPQTVDLYLLTEDGERAEHDLAGIALHRIEVVAGRRCAADIGARATRVYPEAWPPLKGAGADVPHFGSLKATNYSETDKYALFEVAIDGLQFGRRVEPGARFKVSKANGRLSLEFRQGRHWPKLFHAWPGREQDRFGDVFRVAEAGDNLAIAGELAAGPDREVLAALCRLMPTVVAAAVQTFPTAAGQVPAWLDAARAMSAAAYRTFGEPGA